ncbi:65-kda microtubule-associated protein 3 [Phtheirospermum japonicum]|uniref:65-kDa microtubule-associated protein 3 n=1 Tax=Phtheirospermum japonicum TaxID=374723 RepID=A0A830CYJ3_9LAMI|nr:65-kda microtubule-associated protein 3 [Phtheirospermum japonicum]
MAACEEESWLEEYNRDDNRYNAGRGAHLALKRAEKARVLVNKLPAIVDALASKVIAWENEEGKEFSYNGVRLLSMLEAYIVLREQKEIERKRQRDQKKLQGQLLAEQEALYGAKPSPKKTQSVKKEPRLSSCGGGGAGKRKLSLGAPMLQTPKRDTRPSSKATPDTRKAKTNVRTNKDRVKDDGLSAFSTGRRVSDMAGRLPFKHSPNVVNETEQRKPFTPISTTNPSKKSNATNIFKDPNKKHDDTLHKTLVRNNTPSTPPPKTIYRADEENITPKTTGINLYSTPSTVFVPMQTALTPPISTQTATMPTFTIIKSVEEEIEYSFEEKRAGFVMKV